MVNFTNSFFRKKIQHKHQQCDETLSTLVNFSSVKKLMQKVKINKVAI